MSHHNSFLTDQDLKLLQAAGDIVAYAANEVVVHQDSATGKLRLIRSGLIKIDFSRIYANDTLALLGPGEFIGEVSFLDQGETSASAIAAEACEILEIPHRALHELLAGDDGLSARFYRTIALTLASRIRSANRQ